MLYPAFFQGGCIPPIHGCLFLELKIDVRAPIPRIYAHVHIIRCDTIITVAQPVKGIGLLHLSQQQKKISSLHALWCLLRRLMKASIVADGQRHWWIYTRNLPRGHNDRPMPQSSGVTSCPCRMHAALSGRTQFVQKNGNRQVVGECDTDD